jgi:hypothetical protein
MHNHIEIKFKNIATPGLVIGHNQQLLADKFLNSTFIVDIDHCIEKNTFWILGQCEITCLTMFGLGAEKLKYLGSQIDPNTKQEYNTHQVSPDNRWQLHYDFPVFAWLHKTLHFGWLIERY